MTEIPKLQSACSQCNLQELCLPIGLSEAELSLVDSLVDERRKVARGEAIFRAGERFTAIYAVKLGFFKTEVLSEDGRHQVTSFYMPGEVLGMDGILERSKRHAVEVGPHLQADLLHRLG